MSDISSIPSKGSYLAALELWREPNGAISARLTDVPVPVIESTGANASDRMVQVALWALQGGVFLLLNAACVREPNVAKPSESAVSAAVVELMDKIKEWDAAP